MTARRGHPSARPQSVVGAWVGLLAAVIAFVVFNLYRKAEAPTAPPRAVAVVSTPTPAPREVPVRMALLSLPPGRVMAGGAESSVTLASTVEVLRLELLVEDPALGHAHVAVATSDHREVWAGDVASVPVEGGAIVTVDVPAARFREASAYEVTVFREPRRVRSGTYYFTVARP